MFFRALVIIIDIPVDFLIHLKASASIEMLFPFLQAFNLHGCCGHLTYRGMCDRVLNLQHILGPSTILVYPGLSLFLTSIKGT